MWQALKSSTHNTQPSNTASENTSAPSAPPPLPTPELNAQCPKGSKQYDSLSSKKVPSATESFGSSEFDKLKMGKDQFRESDDGTVDRVPRTQTHISSTEVGRDGLGIPLNIVEVKTNMDWQNVSREDLRR